MTTPVAITLAVVGAAAGVLASRIADTVLAARDDAPPPGPAWQGVAAAAVGAVLFPVGVWVAGDWWLAPAFATFAVLTLTLAITDLRARLIPDRINIRGSLGCAALLVAGAVASDEATSLGRAAAGAAGAAAFYLVLYVLGRGRSFGFGDVKLAPVLGLFTAFVGWDAFTVGVFAGIVVGGLAAAVLLVFRLKAARDHFAFGPALIAGAWIGLVWGESIAAWYLG